MYRKEDKIMRIITEKIEEDIKMLCSHLAYNDTVIAHEIIKIIDKYTDNKCSYFQLLGALYKYGKMEGVRLERERKKALANIKS